MIDIKITANVTSAVQKLDKTAKLNTYLPVLQAALNQLLQAHRNNTPGTGKLKQGWGTNMLVEDTKATLQVTNTAPNARNILRWLRTGTKRHFIRPSSRRVMTFTGKAGDTVYTRLVRHPGTRPHPQMKTMDTQIKTILAQLNQKIAEAANKA